METIPWMTVLLWIHLGADIPPPPVLKLDPLSQRVKEGDCLFLLCFAEGSITEKKFHFYKDGVEITSREEGHLKLSTEPTNPLQNASLRIPHASFNHSGEFACSYEEKRSNRWIMSSLSQGRNITVEPAGLEESPPKEQSGPTRENRLTQEKTGGTLYYNLEAASHLLQPIREEEEDGGDESLAQPGIMSPSRNSTFLPSLFQSFCGSSWNQDQSGLIIEDEHLSINTFNVTTENLSSGQIKIICICKIMERLETSGTWPYSPESNQLVFSVVGVPPSPLLKVDLLTQRVKEGDPLVFLCSTEGGITEKKFHFYKDGVEITSSKECLLEPSSEPTNPLQNASLRIPHASFNHSGEFACSYEEKRSNRWIMSSWSQGVNITVEPVSTQDSDPIWRYYRVAITIMILLVPFAFYCWTKKSILLWILLESGVPPSPLLKVDLLTQRVKEGDPLVFLCSTEGGITEKKFHFYKDGVEITSSKECLLEPSSEPTNPLQNASLRIPHASFNHSGEFACSHEEKRSNRWIMSSWSQGVNITVEPEFPPMEQSQLAEKKEERDNLGMMEPPASTAATASPVKVSPSLSAESGSVDPERRKVIPWSSSAQRKEASQRRSSTSTRMGWRSPPAKKVFLNPPLSPQILFKMPLRIPHASLNHSGEFACSYEEKRSNRWIMSSWSQGVNITVEPVLCGSSWKQVSPFPLLKVDLLTQRVKEGDPLVFLCSTEGGITEKKFHFYKDGVEITSREEERAVSEEVNGLNGFPYLESQMAPDVVGDVDREILQEGKKGEPGLDLREIGTIHEEDGNKPFHDSEATYCHIQDSFTRSSPGPTRENFLLLMNLGAADMPPPPVLKSDPLSQRVKEGDCLFLLCLAEGSITEKKFHFYKDGVEITSSQECLPKNSSEPEDLLQSGSLRILCDNSTHNGEFACIYEQKRSI
ncbi:hypothetical protein E2320_003641 [Naja naja]|nr:hypothetical protein E2320_003641 [Naja naja]